MDGGRRCGSDDEITGLIIPHVSRKWNIRLTARRSAHPPGLKCMAMYCSSSEDNISLNESFVTAESRCFACSLLFFCELRTAAVHHVGVIGLRDQGEECHGGRII